MVLIELAINRKQHFACVVCSAKIPYNLGEIDGCSELPPSCTLLSRQVDRVAKYRFGFHLSAARGKCASFHASGNAGTGSA